MFVLAFAVLWILVVIKKGFGIRADFLRNKLLLVLEELPSPGGAGLLAAELQEHSLDTRDLKEFCQARSPDEPASLDLQSPAVLFQFP